MITIPDMHFTDGEGNLTLQSLNWVEEITIQGQRVFGTGSPEGAITAEQGVLYIDEAAGTGSVLYVKRDGSDGSGDRSKGWILV